MFLPMNLQSFCGQGALASLEIPRYAYHFSTCVLCIVLHYERKSFNRLEFALTEAEMALVFEHFRRKLRSSLILVHTERIVCQEYFLDGGSSLVVNKSGLG